MTDEVRTAPKDVHVDEVRDLVARGKEKGWLTADEIADALGALDLSAEQVDNVYALVAEEGIEVVDHVASDMKECPLATAIVLIDALGGDAYLRRRVVAFNHLQGNKAIA